MLFRKKAVELYNAQYKSNAILAILKISRSSLSAIVRKDKEGLSLEDKARSGRPKALTRRGERRLVTKSRNNPFMTPKQLKAEVPIAGNLSNRGIRRYLSNNGLHGRIAAPKPKLSQVHIEKRMAFCRSKDDWTLADWNRVIFTDESKLEINPRRRQFVRRPVNTRHEWKFCTQTTKFCKSIMVWGAIRGDGYRTLVKCEGNVNAAEYQRILEAELPTLYSDPSKLFQQDGATCHTAKSTLRFLDTKHVSVLLNYPPQSPDLSIIENLWKTLKDRVNDRNPQTLDELWEVAKDEWLKIDAIDIKRLYGSMPGRVDRILGAQGRSISA